MQASARSKENIELDKSQIGVAVVKDDDMYGDMSYFENKIKKSAACIDSIWTKDYAFNISIIASHAHAFRDHVLSRSDFK